MSEEAVQTESELSRPSTEVVVGRILLGGVAGAAGGMLMGGIPFSSVVMALFGALGGAVCGMIAAASQLEPN